MTNIEQFINYNKRTCQYQNQNNDSNNPSIDNSDLNIPQRISEYLLVDNFLSEYNTNSEKELIMQNILLLDKIPTEGSTRLVNSDTVFKVMRENKNITDQILTLVNRLETNKVDKQQLNESLSLKANIRDLARIATSGSYNDLSDKPTKLSQFVNDVGFITQSGSTDPVQEYDPTELINLINTKANVSDIPTKVSELINDAGYINQHQDISNKADKSEIQKFIITNESAYEALNEYVQDAVYLVLEDEEPEVPEHTGWRLGDGLPMILSGDWKFGDNLPIILT